MEEKYYHTKSSVEEYIKMAKGSNGWNLISKLKDFLPARSTLLELGSGPGTDYEILCETFDITGSDSSDEFLKYLAHKCRDGHFIELDAETITTIQHFDGIYSNKVLHHLNDVALQTSIKRQYEILNGGGIICHSFWEGEGEENFKGLYVNYHTEEEFRTCFAEYFEILVLEAYTEFEEGDSLLLIGKKK